MDAAAYLSHLRSDLAAFEACLGGDLAAPVAHCGRWTLYDLADHLGGGNLWAAAAVTERRGDLEAAPGPRDPAALAAWLSGTGAVLLAALDADPDAPAWTIAPPPTVGFWQRRRCMETLIHRWDAEHAVAAGGFIDPALADDGVAEVVDTMLPRQIRLGRTHPPPHAVRLTATDTGSSWLLGPGDPVAAVEGTAAGLLLVLWGRLAADDPALSWSGDREQGRAALNRALVP
ncbi:MAG TPA: maleylpyruvate isomerase family mycothiol-dependent enzyme [Streptosporangiaceae bacterium]|nr:maleylpyruvate isomerase family mycothiol-dependent enzyme [Streptosporangiaceae bacterium]